ncbi:MAG TPA: hypothetical protein VF811_12900 [Parasulfuritortus sp.]
MNMLISLLPLIILFGMFAVSAKLASILLRRVRISWPMCFLYSLIVVLLSASVRTLLALLGLPVSGAVAGAIGLAVQLAFGTGYFAVRASRASGEDAGWRNGLLLTVLTLVIVIVVAVLLMLLAGLLRTQLMH